MFSLFSWGCDHEKIALSQYVDEVSPQHENFEICNCGLVINPSYPHLGASPDGIVACDCHGVGVIEVKCPYCVRKQSPDRAIEMLKYLECQGDEVHLKETDAYYYQVQAQLNICEVSYADFIVWTEAGMFVERILPQSSFFIKAVTEMERFYKYAVLPELLGKWYTKQPVIPSSDDSPATPLQVSLLAS